MKATVILIFLICSCAAIQAQDQFTNFGNFHTFSGAAVTFFGNLANNGTFTDAGQAVSFKGSGTISGTSTTTLYNLIVDTNTSSITLNQNMIVTNSLVLTSGGLNLNSKTLTINNSAASALSRTTGYIVSEQTNNAGKIKWNIGTNTQAHVFPFGTASGGYIPFTLAVTAGDVGNVTISTYPTASNNTPLPSTPVAVSNINAAGVDNSANVVDRFWQIDKDGPSGTATLTFTASPAEIGTITDLKAQRWNSTSGAWDSPLSGQTSSATGAIVSGVTEFSPWTLSGNNIILPIELIQFIATVIAGDVELNWETASEINNDYFTVQRSQDGITFSDLTKISGAGTSTIAKAYNYLDTSAPLGRSYYRLMQTDFDGRSEYSEIRMVEIDNSGRLKITAYPNPVTNSRFTIDFQPGVERDLSVSFYDVMGRPVLQELVKAGIRTFEVNFNANLSPGIYLLKVSNGTESDEQTIVVR